MRSVWRGGVVAVAVLVVAVPGIAGAGVPATSRWRISYRVGPVPSTLDAAVAVSPRQVWAIGRAFDRKGPVPTLPVVRRWNGRAWQVMRLPRAYRRALLVAVAGSSPRNIWLFGWTVALRWNGRRWSSVRLPANSDVEAAATLGPADTWLFGTSATWHYDGTRWRRSRPGFMVSDASAVSRRDVWAVGEGRDRPALARWDGRRWRRVPVPSVGPGPYQFLFGVLALPGGDVWVTGGFVRGLDDLPVALRYRHGTWKRFRGRGEMLGQAVADGAGGIWAAYSSADDLTTLVHIRAGRWQQVALPTVPGKHTSITSLVRLPRSGTIFGFGDLFWGATPTRTDGLILKHAP
jgi:hypothetical protein